MFPLHEAILNQYNSSQINELVSSGIDIESQNQDNQTPLRVAVVKGSDDQVQALITLGANIDVCDSASNHTLLHHAVFNQRADVISTLIKAGANIEARDKEGLTPLDYAKMWGVEPIKSVFGINQGKDSI